MDINTKYDKATDDVVSEALARNWKRAIEATLEIASMIKSSGLGKRIFGLVMQNLNIKLRAASPTIAEEFAQVLIHREHYLSNSRIILPFRSQNHARSHP